MPTSETTARKIRVLIVDDILETRENVHKLLYFENDIEIIGMAANGNEGVDLAGKLQPDIILMDINMPGMDGIAASEAIVSQYPNCQIVMMSVQGEADYLRRSMLAGAREFLIKPFSGEELANSIRRVHQLAAGRRVVAAVAAPPADEPAPAVPAAPKGGKVIAVFGTKGGCGASTLAVNIAVALREETKEKVALVDANFEFGDIGVLLNLPTNRTIADLTGPSVDLDEELLTGTMASHGSGIKALLAPQRPEMAELVAVDHIKRILELLPRCFDYVVLDLPRSFREPMVTLLEAADQVLLVATNDIPAIKNARLFFETIEAIGISPDKILLTLNKEDGRGGISVKDIESSIKHPVRAVIPRDEKTTRLAVNQGAPFVTLQRNFPLSAAVVALARAVRRPAPVNVPAAAAPVPAGSPKTGWLHRK